MSVVLPFDNTLSNFSEQLTLENELYTFEFIWNERAEQWDMSILDIDQVSIVEGIKLVLNYDLFDQYPGRGLPPGALFAIDTTGDEKRITRDNIGDVVQLMYLTEAEFDAI